MPPKGWKKDVDGAAPAKAAAPKSTIIKKSRAVGKSTAIASETKLAEDVKEAVSGGSAVTGQYGTPTPITWDVLTRLDTHIANLSAMRQALDGTQAAGVLEFEIIAAIKHVHRVRNSMPFGEPPMISLTERTAEHHAAQPAKTRELDAVREEFKKSAQPIVSPPPAVSLVTPMSTPAFVPVVPQQAPFNPQV